MSRIDDAVKLWESGQAVEQPLPASPQAGGIGGSPLNQYPHETAAPASRVRPEPAPERKEAEPTFPSESQQPDRPAPDAGRKTSRPQRSHDHEEIEARRITGASNPVSLEQYRRLAAVLHEEQVQKQLKTVMITSALPQEGKTLTIANLAMTLSESYARRVLVIDADLRWPSLHGVLGVANGRGLSEALRDGGHDLPFTEVSGHLSALTAGRPGPMPLAGLTSERMAQVIDECAARFDWVLVDTPPVGMLPDAQVLARLVGAVIFVIRAGSTPAAAVERAIADLGLESIIGTVLNRVEERRIPEAGYYSEYGSFYAGRKT